MRRLAMRYGTVRAVAERFVALPTSCASLENGLKCDTDCCVACEPERAGNHVVVRRVILQGKL